MRRKTKILILVLGAVVIISLAVGGVMVFAADNGSTSSTTTSTNDAFLTALAGKLNISVDQLETAIKEARSEVQGQALQDRLQKLVDEGKITESQMEEYLQWWNSKPSISDDLGTGRCDGGRGFGMMGGRGNFGGGFRLPQTTTTTANN